MSLPISILSYAAFMCLVVCWFCCAVAPLLGPEDAQSGEVIEGGNRNG